MKAMSGVLESSYWALSIRRIASLIGGLLIQSIRLKTVLESRRQLEIHLRSQIFTITVPNNQNRQYDNHSKALIQLYRLVPSLVSKQEKC